MVSHFYTHDQVNKRRRQLVMIIPLKLYIKNLYYRPQFLVK